MEEARKTAKSHTGFEKNEEDYRSIIENSLNALILAKPDGTVLDVNSATIDMFGYSIEELRKIGRAGFIDETDPRFGEMIALREKEHKLKGELTGIRKNGERFPCEVSSVIFTDTNGEKRTSTTIIDISERKKAEEEMALLMNNTEESFIVLDKELKIISFNKKFEEGYRHFLGKEVKKGKNILDYAQPGRKEEVREVYKKVLLGEVVEQDINVTVLNKTRTFSNRYKPLYDKDQQLIGVFVTAVDTTERKTALQLLAASEKTFRSLIENSAEIISLCDKEGIITYISPSYEKITGIAVDDILGKRMANVMHPDFVKKSETVLQLLLDNPGLPIPRTNRFLCKDGSYIWVEGTSTNFLYDKNIQAIVGNYHDVTDRKKAEEQKEFEANNLKALINNTNDLMWSVDRDFKLITSNAAFDRIAQRLIGRLIEKGENLLKAGFTNREIESYKQYHERAFAGEIFTVIEYSRIPHDFWTEISFHPIYRQDEIIGTACYSRNITKSKSFERELEKSAIDLVQIKNKLEYNEFRLKQAQAIAHVGHWEVNFLTGIAEWSDEACKIYGIPRDEKIKSFELWMSLIHPDDLEMVQQQLTVSDESHQDLSFYHRIVRRDGKIRHVHSQAKFEFDGAQKPIGLYGVVHDITEFKKQEQEKETLIAELTQNNYHLRQFSYITSHNLRAPIANLLGLSSLIDSFKINDKELKQILDYMRSSALKFDEIIKDLNTVLFIKDNPVISKEELQFSIVFEKIKEQCQLLIEKSDMKMHVDFSNAPVIAFNKSYLESIFLNLFTNALKYQSPKRKLKISVTTENQQGNVVMKFSDNGTGVDVELQKEKIFQLYQRFHEHVEGRGLGLFLIRSQIEALGGSISIESKVNEGTTFILVFKK